MTRRLVNVLDSLPDHNEAWSLAHIRAENSNLARCYIELRKVAKELTGAHPDFAAGYGPIKKLREICNAND